MKSCMKDDCMTKTFPWLPKYEMARNDCVLKHKSRFDYDYHYA